MCGRRRPLAAALASATTVPANVLGLAGEVGGLRPGLRADVLVVDERLKAAGVMRAGLWLDPLAG